MLPSVPWGLPWGYPGDTPGYPGVFWSTPGYRGTREYPSVTRGVFNSYATQCNPSIPRGTPGYHRVPQGPRGDVQDPSLFDRILCSLCEPPLLWISFCSCDLHASRLSSRLFLGAPCCSCDPHALLVSLRSLLWAPCCSCELHALLVSSWLFLWALGCSCEPKALLVCSPSR